MIKGYKSPLIEFIRANPGCTSEEITTALGYKRHGLTCKLSREIKKTGESVGVRTSDYAGVSYRYSVIDKKQGVYCIDPKKVKCTFDASDHKSVQGSILSEFLFEVYCEIYKNRGVMKSAKYYEKKFNITKAKFHLVTKQLRNHGCILEGAGFRNDRSVTLAGYEKPDRVKRKEEAKELLRPTTNQLLNGVFR